MKCPYRGSQFKKDSKRKPSVSNKDLRIELKSDSSSVKKLQQGSGSIKASKDKTIKSIKSYFSPTKCKSKFHVDPAANSSDFSDDDLIMFQDIATVDHLKSKTCSDLNLCKSSKKQSTKLNFNTKVAEAGRNQPPFSSLKEDKKTSVECIEASSVDVDAISSCNENASVKCREASSVDVDVIYNDDIDMTSLESEHHTFYSATDVPSLATHMSQTCSREEHVNTLPVDRSSEPIESTGNTEAADLEVKDVREETFNSKIFQSGNSSVSNECEHLEEDKLDLDMPISSNDEMPKCNAPSCSKMSPLKDHSSSEELIREDIADKKLEGRKEGIGGMECSETESGGFLLETDNLIWDDLDEEKILEPLERADSTSDEHADVAKKETMSICLHSSASWPMVHSSSAKQSTILSFFKLKSGSEDAASCSKAMVHPNILRTKSTSMDTTAHHQWKSHPLLRSSPANPVPSSSRKDTVGFHFQEPSDMFQEEMQTGYRKKQCPFYKKMPGTSITVDAFRYGIIPGCEAYVLTHFHYDHYGGLTKKFCQPIYCSQVTGNLVESRIGVDKKWIHRLPMWQPCDVAGTTLTLMEANHCPGAVIILFELKDGRKLLHTGDFRASPEMESYRALQDIKISQLYLDTTYCKPEYAFPDQKDVVHFVVNLVLNFICEEPSTLIVCGAYTIGKERIFAAIAKALDSKICVLSDKKKVLDCLEDEDLKSRVTRDWSLGKVHVLPMAKLKPYNLREHLARHPKFKKLLAFEPTGWTHNAKNDSLLNIKPKWSKDGMTLYGVPYSEHSSYLELKRFVQHFQPQKILPTVNNGNAASRNKMDAIFKEWMNEKMLKKK